MRKPLKPFLKWAGGKRWLFESGQFRLPEFSGKYIEPFLGGGAVFFENQPRNAILSDFNGRLIELYQQIRDNLEDFEILLAGHAESHSKEYYYQTRAQQFDSAVERAAQFLYLNRTCWNGLYRENLKGEFNVPIGTKQTVIFESDNFGAWSKALRGVILENKDFEEAINEAHTGDFIFVDPPYTVRHNLNGFVKYNQKIFSWNDQERLRDALKRAHARGVSFALTNADHQSIRDLYCGFGDQKKLWRHSVIAGNAENRTLSSELLISALRE
ncbi:DNA adenine methylase [Gimibacter soli]|uniref:Site-specific DNA-methyltransferase (adenine-specific) n=1 Tax=Gimibacter soli TaxID=3024400 RepID=A0AAE9XNN4_9PROT|nr:Dam family site-specific DNA-(adenine-N6)-methyltransferase [Gimibacter soli]WCL54357.1 Dam family site-specific DNA-(adenine-N6)-methyltransferase [Gimibacter soli]